jgi:V8-like Glu-specific endopeptidase
MFRVRIAQERRCLVILASIVNRTFVRLGILSSLAVVAGCIQELDSIPLYESGHESVAEEDVAMSEYQIVGGTVTSARPEVGWIGNCTATLITPRHFVTAAHCINYAAESLGGTFTIGSNSYGIERIMAFDNKLRTYDVALGRLATAVPAAVATPARIAGDQPANGTTVTVMGYGCDDRNPVTGTGTKRHATFAWNTTTTRVCYGDSGGPVFVGGVNDGGPMVGINSGHWGGYGDESGADIFADPTYFKERIEHTIRDWEDDFEPGVDRPGSDYRSLVTPTATACRSECTHDGACRAFSYVSSTSTCWLKNSVAEAYPNANVTSGLPKRIGTFDRGGSDYSSYASPSAQHCSADCARAGASCKAFTYVTSTGVCWLKSTTPGASACSVCKSGNRRGLERDTNRPGSDYATAITPSANACARQCAQEDRCLAFAWQAASNTCWLKDAVPAAGYSSGITSGVRRGWDVNTNRAGSDFHSFVLSDPQPERCQAACERDSRCMAWTLTTGPSNGENRCWLKNAIPAGYYAAGMISGLKGMSIF